MRGAPHVTVIPGDHPAHQSNRMGKPPRVAKDDIKHTSEDELTSDHRQLSNTGLASRKMTSAISLVAPSVSQMIPPMNRPDTAARTRAMNAVIPTLMRAPKGPSRKSRAAARSTAAQTKSRHNNCVDHDTDRT